MRGSRYSREPAAMAGNGSWSGAAEEVIAMPRILDQLQDEHRNALRILGALERQLAAFDKMERPDYDILQAIAAYFTGFPERCHHPKEDLIYRKLVERRPQQWNDLFDLEAEHRQLSAQAHRFKDVVDRILLEAELPREIFTTAAQEFIANQRRHMRLEEERFFPEALKSLTGDDWEELDSQVSNDGDPIFAKSAAEAYVALRENIIQWERESRAGL